MLIDLSILAATGIAASWCCIERPGGLSRTMLMAWLMSLPIFVLIQAGLLRESYVPGALAMVDMVVAISALFLWTTSHDQRARIVGGISMAMMCCHFGFAAAHGGMDWGVYALILNVGFMAQCWTAGGGFNGVVDFLDRLWRRHHRGHHAGGRS